MKKVCILLACMGMVLSLHAVPAKRGVTKTVTNADGTTLTISLRGDETFHYYVDEKGNPVREDEQGNWVADSRDVKALWKTANAKRNIHRKALRQKTQRMMRAPRRTKTEVQTKKGLLILVNFKDKKMANGDNSKAIFDQEMNGLNNPYGKNYGSVREYFRAQSYGQFDIHFDVVGPITVSKNMSYYGKDIVGGAEGDDEHAPDMILEAIDSVDNQVNFADYDWDGDGEVENIYVTYAGYSQAAGASSNTIWPHQWQLSEAFGETDSWGNLIEPYIVMRDGVRIDTYACGSELSGISGKTIDGIGTMCHEYSHCLGLPDFYDTAGDSFGMSVWSLMDYGCYNGDGCCPAGYTAYERWYSGWLEPVELNEATTIADMPNIEEHPVAYVIYNEKRSKDKTGEYYLLANHQQVGWDQKAYGHGMMVLHVDYDQESWTDNSVNNTSSQQRMTIIPADNDLSVKWDYNSEIIASYLTGDLFPGSSRKTQLTDTSTPKASLYNANTDGKKLMHKPITNITETNGLISFDFMGGKQVVVEAPIIDMTQSSASGTSVNVIWNAVETAASYNLQYTVKTSGEGGGQESDALKALTVWEDFSKFKAQNDGTTNLADKLDDYTSVPGWTGDKIYKGQYGVKMATSSGVGVLTSPTLTCTAKTVTVYLLSYLYKSDNTTLKVSINGNSQTVTPNAVNDNTPAILTFTDVPASYQLKIETNGKKRAYLVNLLAFDGTVTQADIESILENGNPSMVTNPTNEKTYTLTGITSSDYSLTELPENSQISIKVQTVDAEGYCSAWSDLASFNIGEGTTTGIDRILSAKTPMVFDLAGRRIVDRSLRRGIYILNGKKILIQ